MGQVRPIKPNGPFAVWLQTWLGTVATVSGCTGKRSPHQRTCAMTWSIGSLARDASELLKEQRSGGPVRPERERRSRRRGRSRNRSQWECPDPLASRSQSRHVGPPRSPFVAKSASSFRHTTSVPSRERSVLRNTAIRSAVTPSFACQAME